MIYNVAENILSVYSGAFWVHEWQQSEDTVSVQIADHKNLKFDPKHLKEFLGTFSNNDVEFSEAEGNSLNFARGLNDLFCSGVNQNWIVGLDLYKIDQKLIQVYY